MLGCATDVWLARVFRHPGRPLQPPLRAACAAACEGMYDACARVETSHRPPRRSSVQFEEAAQQNAIQQQIMDFQQRQGGVSQFVCIFIPLRLGLACSAAGCLVVHAAAAAAGDRRHPTSLAPLPPLLPLHGHRCCRPAAGDTLRAGSSPADMLTACRCSPACCWCPVGRGRASQWVPLACGRVRPR